MKTIAFHTQKGGAGKTSLTGNIAYLLSLADKKVLIVDLDSSQGNMLIWTHETKKREEIYNNSYEIGDYFNSINSPKNLREKKLENIIVPIRKNLDLLPTFNVGSSLKEYISSKINSPEETFTIKRFIDDVERLGYDFLFFDLAPAMQSLEQRITLFIDEIIPITPASHFGIEGVITNKAEHDRLEYVQREIRKKPLVRNKIILNAYDKRNKDHRTAYEILEKSGQPFFPIRTAVLIDKLQKQHKFLTETEDTHEVIKDYLNLTSIILKESEENEK